MEIKSNEFQSNVLFGVFYGDFDHCVIKEWRNSSYFKP